MGGHGLRVRTIECSHGGVEVVVTDEGDNVVRPLDGGLVKLLTRYFNINIFQMG